MNESTGVFWPKAWFGLNAALSLLDTNEKKDGEGRRRGEEMRNRSHHEWFTLLGLSRLGLGMHPNLSPCVCVCEAMCLRERLKHAQLHKQRKRWEACGIHGSEIPTVDALLCVSYICMNGPPEDKKYILYPHRNKKKKKNQLILYKILRYYL